MAPALALRLCANTVCIPRLVYEAGHNWLVSLNTSVPPPPPTPTSDTHTLTRKELERRQQNSNPANPATDGALLAWRRGWGLGVGE